MDLLTAGVSIVGSVLAGGGGASVVAALAKRRTAPADSAKTLTDAAMLQVDQLQERVKDAEATTARTQQRLHEVEREAEDAHQQVRALRRAAADLEERLSLLARWIHTEGMTVDTLKVRVPLPLGRNGQG